MRLALDPLGQPEIGHPWRTVLVQKDIARLQIAVDDALHVGVGDCFGHLLHQGRRLARFHHALGHAARQALPVHKGHREVMLPLVLADLENGHDARVIQLGRRFRLAVEPLHVLVAGQLPDEDHLQGHNPVQTDLSGLVHHPHAAAGDLFQKLVVAKIADFRAGKRY